MKPSKQTNKQTEVIKDIKLEEDIERFQHASDFFFFVRGTGEEFLYW